MLTRLVSLIHPSNGIYLYSTALRKRTRKNLKTSFLRFLLTLFAFKDKRRIIENEVIAHDCGMGLATIIAIGGNDG